MESASATRIPSLDGVRAIAVLLVIGGHLGRNWGSVVFLPIFGVHVFFVLSGYLITTLLQQEREGRGRIDLIGFYLRRCFRIFPAAFAFMAVIALIEPATRSALLYAATYTVSYHLSSTPLVFWHLWSLSVEEQFYLIWPLALLLAYQRRVWVAWLAMIAAAGFRLAMVLNGSTHDFAFVHYSFPGTMDSIAAGCLLAIYYPQIRQRWKWMTESAAVAIAIPVTAWILATTCFGDSRIKLVRDVGSTMWGLVPLLIALSLFVLIERADKILNNPVAATIGVLSYSLYLWQQPFTVSDQHSAWQAVLMLTGCAVASYRLVEKPMLKLGALLKGRRTLRVPLGSELPSPVRE